MNKKEIEADIKNIVTEMYNVDENTIVTASKYLSESIDNYTYYSILSDIFLKMGNIYSEDVKKIGLAIEMINIVLESIRNLPQFCDNNYDKNNRASVHYIFGETISELTLISYICSSFNLIIDSIQSMKNKNIIEENKYFNVMEISIERMCNNISLIEEEDFQDKEINSLLDNNFNSDKKGEIINKFINEKKKYLFELSILIPYIIYRDQDKQEEISILAKKITDLYYNKNDSNLEYECNNLLKNINLECDILNIIKKI
tara:strand:+ start:652 stop:1428 length:777 start_codon:yes stop_codon:yes gene_type:complete